MPHNPHTAGWTDEDWDEYFERAAQEVMTQRLGTPLNTVRGSFVRVPLSVEERKSRKDEDTVIRAMVTNLLENTELSFLDISLRVGWNPTSVARFQTKHRINRPEAVRRRRGYDRIGTFYNSPAHKRDRST